MSFDTKTVVFLFTNLHTPVSVLRNKLETKKERIIEKRKKERTHKYINKDWINEYRIKDNKLKIVTDNQYI